MCFMDPKMTLGEALKTEQSTPPASLNGDTPQQLPTPKTSLEHDHEPVPKQPNQDSSSQTTQPTSQEPGNDLTTPAGTTSAIVSIQTFDVDDLPVLANHDREQRRLQTLNYLACCWTMVLSGWNDGSLGPLLPTMQSYYKVCVI